MTASTRTFDDIELGTAMAAGGYEVRADEIVAFAERYDPRPYHLDEEAARDSLFGGLVASGIHTIGMWNRLRFEAEAGLAQLAGLGLDALRFHHPVRPGDRLSLRAECVEKRRSKAKPDCGIVRFRHTLSNQADEPVMTCEVTLMVAARGGGAGESRGG